MNRTPSAEALAAQKRVELAARRVARDRLARSAGVPKGDVTIMAMADSAAPALVDSAERRAIRRLLAASLPGGEVEFWGLVEQEL